MKPHPEKPRLYHPIPKKRRQQRCCLCFLWLCLSLLFLLSVPRERSPPSLSLRIFVYDLPPQFNLAWLSNPRCSSHLFASEVAFHEALLRSPFRTLDPFLADFFFLPVYLSCNFSTPTGFPCLRHARPLLASAVRLVSAQLPFWNRSQGADHVLVASHDFGACFHAMEDAAVASGIPEFLKKTILLQTFGVLSPHPCQAANHVVIPPYVAPAAGNWPSPETANRDIFVFFRGKMEIHPKNVSGHFYSRRVRTEIWRKYGSNPRFHLRRHRSGGYQSEIARSVFCLCPLGWAPWSPRLVESVALGCVPVIVADGIRLPFSDAVPWQAISLTVPERQVAGIEAILDRVAATNLSAIQRRLWNPAVRRALLFNRDGIFDGDASWNVLRGLESMLRRRSLRHRPWHYSEP